MALGHLGHALAVACARHARQADGRAAGRPLGHLGHLGQKKISGPNDPKEKGRGIQGIPWRAGFWVIWVIARQVLAYDVHRAQDYVAILYYIILYSKTCKSMTQMTQKPLFSLLHSLGHPCHFRRPNNNPKTGANDPTFSPLILFLFFSVSNHQLKPY